MPEIRIVLIGLAVIVGLWILFSMFRSIPQATVAVVTIFGKFQRVMREGAALLVKRTKDAEAEAAYKTIGAEAEKKASSLRGEGLALFRRNMAEGMKEAADTLRAAGVDSNFLLYLEYTDALKYVADHAQGKVIFMDSGAGAAQRIIEGIAGLGGDAGPTAAAK